MGVCSLWAVGFGDIKTVPGGRLVGSPKQTWNGKPPMEALHGLGTPLSAFCLQDVRCESRACMRLLPGDGRSLLREAWSAKFGSSSGCTNQDFGAF